MPHYSGPALRTNAYSTLDGRTITREEMEREKAMFRESKVKTNIKPQQTVPRHLNHGLLAAGLRRHAKWLSLTYDFGYMDDQVQMINLAASVLERNVSNTP
jgi:hypothetical protein